jgi:hypothetical protein
MFPRRDQPELNRLLQQLTCRVAVPEWYLALESKQGAPRSPVRADERRQFVRYYFLKPAVLQFPGNLSALKREPGPFVVPCLDISRCGIAFLHEGPLYPEEEITLWLPLGRLPYVVRRCQRHHERCYEIGAKSGTAD